MDEVETYILLHQNTIAQYIATSLILELYLEAKWFLVEQVERIWWEQGCLYLNVVWEAASVAETLVEIEMEMEMEAETEAETEPKTELETEPETELETDPEIPHIVPPVVGDTAATQYRGALVISAAVGGNVGGRGWMRWRRTSSSTRTPLPSILQLV